jgi:hypothetical protein
VAEAEVTRARRAIPVFEGRRPEIYSLEHKKYQDEQ